MSGYPEFGYIKTAMTIMFVIGLTLVIIFGTLGFLYDTFIEDAKDFIYKAFEWLIWELFQTEVVS